MSRKSSDDIEALDLTMWKQFYTWTSFCLNWGDFNFCQLDTEIFVYATAGIWNFFWGKKCRYNVFRFTFLKYSDLSVEKGMERSNQRRKDHWDYIARIPLKQGNLKNLMVRQLDRYVGYWGRWLTWDLVTNWIWSENLKMIPIFPIWIIRL